MQLKRIIVEIACVEKLEIKYCHFRGLGEERYETLKITANYLKLQEAKKCCEMCTLSTTNLQFL